MACFRTKKESINHLEIFNGSRYIEENVQNYSQYVQFAISNNCTGKNVSKIFKLYLKLIVPTDSDP